MREARAPRDEVGAQDEAKRGSFKGGAGIAVAEVRRGTRRVATSIGVINYPPLGIA
jgi:hypothetical protein